MLIILTNLGDRDRGGQGGQDKLQTDRTLMEPMRRGGQDRIQTEMIRSQGMSGAPRTRFSSCDVN